MGLTAAQVVAASPRAGATEALRAGTAYLFSLQKDDFHWCAELESNPTVTAEYVFLMQALGLGVGDKKNSLCRWLLGQQKGDGSYGMAAQCAGDVSTTCEVYLALKIMGIAPAHPAMRKARVFVISQGGAAKVRIFTRIFFAMFGLFAWRDTPALPAELIFLPPMSPINIYALASWARGTVVPLLILAHHRPVFALPPSALPPHAFTDELWLNPAHKAVAYLPPWKALLARGQGWALFFAGTDCLLKAYERVHLKGLRAAALRRCTQWILTRQEPSGDWAGIFPPMLNNLLALPLQGYGLHSQPVQRGLAAMERFAWEDGGGRRIQACVSPVWDTVLGLIGLCDAGVPLADTRLVGAAEWIARRQITEQRGDWAVYRPHLQPGGWSFEYDNRWYPDVDDTAAVILALLKQNPAMAESSAVHRGTAWILGMQNPDGGWAAFDADNNKLFLNEAPFADMKALCDPSTADVTGRIIEALGLLHACHKHGAKLPAELMLRMEKACRRGVTFLQATQEATGAWFGRWGVNYIYGTSHVLCGLSRLPWAPPRAACARAMQWLKRVQNSDGGWGESLDTYNDAARAGVGPSTPSQTAWALMGLLGHLPAHDPAIEAGVQWLVTQQVPQADSGATWIEPESTATGFPGHFYVRYDLYRHHFPMMALGRYAHAHLQNA